MDHQGQQRRLSAAEEVGPRDVAGLTHPNEKGLFATGFTRLTGLTSLKNPFHPVNHVNPVTAAMIDNPLPI